MTNKWFGKCNTCKKDNQNLFTMVLTFDNKSRLYLVKNCGKCNMSLLETYRNSIIELIPKEVSK
jgi:uncharacterized protein with PIN domain